MGRGFSFVPLAPMGRPVYSASFSEGIMAEANHIDVSYVANLARIQLTEQETGLFQGQLDQVLAYVEQLNEPDLSGVEPTAHAMARVNILREDAPHRSLENDIVIANAPAARDGQILVPKINDQF